MLRYPKILPAAGLLLLSACAGALPPRPIEGQLSVIDPGGAAARPAAVLVPGCEGAGRHVAFAAEQIARAGFVVVTLDWPADALADCPRQPPSAIADAVVRSATAAREIANVDPARVHLVGWGEGAIGVMAALGDPVRARRTGARSAAGFYPACANLAGWRVGIPFLMILAEDDTVAPPHACAALAERASGGNFVLAIRYGGAGHRFDVETPDAAPAWQFWRRRDDRFNPGVRDAALHDLRIFFDLPSP